MDEEKLIMLVQNYEFLYNTAHPKYMDGARKDAAWSEISNILNQPASACKHKWQSLRDAYRRVLNKRKLKCGQPIAKIKKWKFEDEISFLSKYLGERRKITMNDDDASQYDVDEDIDTKNDIQGITNCYNETDSTDYSQVFSVPTNSTTDPTSSSVSFLNTQKNPQKWANSHPSSSSYVTTSSSEDVNKETEITQDQMDLFFLNISNTVKSFSPYLQAIAKNKIFNLVSELEIQQLAPDKSNSAPQSTPTPLTSNWRGQPENKSPNIHVKTETATNNS